MFVLPPGLETVYANDRPVDLGGGDRFRCHGCKVRLEYTIQEQHAAVPTPPAPQWLGMSNWTAGVVTQNVDGNTIEIDNTRIRLPLVNVFGSGNSTAPHAKLAEQLCPVGSPAWYRTDSMQPNGSYGRTIATVWCEAGHLDTALVMSGHGWIGKYWCDRSEYGTAYWASPCWFEEAGS